MGPYSVLGGLFAALLAAQIGMVYYVPEIEPFRSPVYLPPPLSPAPELLFKPAGPGLYKLELTQHITPFHAENLDLYLIHQAPSSWFLTDAGGFDTWLHPHASQIAQAVNNTIPAGHEFKYILLSHGHLDHVGAVDQLLAAYPDLKVVMHEGEKPWTMGDLNYTKDPTALSTQYRLLQIIGLSPKVDYKLPAQYHGRAEFMSGGEGYLTQQGITDIYFYHIPGHAEGQVAFLHLPTDSLLAADFADVVKNSTTGKLELAVMCGLGGCNEDTAKWQVCRIAHQVPFTKILPYHDITKAGLTRPQLIDLAEDFAQCTRFGFAAPAATPDTAETAEEAAVAPEPAPAAEEAAADGVLQPVDPVVAETAPEAATVTTPVTQAEEPVVAAEEAVVQ